MAGFFLQVPDDILENMLMAVRHIPDIFPLIC